MEHISVYFSIYFPIFFYIFSYIFPILIINKCEFKITSTVKETLGIHYKLKNDIYQSEELSLRDMLSLRELMGVGSSWKKSSGIVAIVAAAIAARAGRGREI